jgi:hypothetical protein
LAAGGQSLNVSVSAALAAAWAGASGQDGYIQIQSGAAVGVLGANGAVAYFHVLPAAAAGWTVADAVAQQTVIADADAAAWSIGAALIFSLLATRIEFDFDPRTMVVSFAARTSTETFTKRDTTIVLDK